MTHAAALRAACSTGRTALGLPAGGVLEAGMPADLLILDLDGLDRDALMPVPAKDLLFNAAPLRPCDREAVHLVGRSTERAMCWASTLTPPRHCCARPITPACRRQSVGAVWLQIERAIGTHYRGCCRCDQLRWIADWMRGPAPIACNNIACSGPGESFNERKQKHDRSDYQGWRLHFWCAAGRGGRAKDLRDVQQQPLPIQAKSCMCAGRARVSGSIGRRGTSA